MTDYVHLMMRAIRRAEAALQIDILVRSKGDIPHSLEAMDTELRGRRFTLDLESPSRYVRGVEMLHAQIYKERSREVFRRQKGLCCFCSKPMRGTEQTECDHKQPRAKGRLDTLDNQRICHSACHRARHDGKIQ